MESTVQIVELHSSLEAREAENKRNEDNWKGQVEEAVRERDRLE